MYGGGVAEEKKEVQRTWLSGNRGRSERRTDETVSYHLSGNWAMLSKEGPGRNTWAKTTGGEERKKNNKGGDHRLKKEGFFPHGRKGRSLPSEDCGPGGEGEVSYRP